MKIIKLVMMLLLITAPILAAETLVLDDALEIESAGRDRLEQALLLLDSSKSSDRRAAVEWLIHLAGRGGLNFGRLEPLLLRAASDRDLETAALADHSLHRLRNSSEFEHELDDQAQQRADASRLQWATKVLSQNEPKGASRSDRLAAAHVLTHLASRPGDWNPDLEWAVRKAWRDHDFEIAHIAERALASRENRDLNPFFAWPATRSREQVEQSLAHQKRADALYAATEAADPETRLSSLQWVLDIAISEGAHSDPRILRALDLRRSDSDPRIASIVRFALDFLAGSRDAAQEVYVGTRGETRQ